MVSDVASLVVAIKACCQEANVEATEIFIHKCLQIWQTMCVRHGMMVVGGPFSGKTVAIRMLGKAITSLQGQGPYSIVKMKTINPKSITMGQLYGEKDPKSDEWNDGILAVIMRKVANKKNGKRYWSVCLSVSLSVSLFFLPLLIFPFELPLFSLFVFRFVHVSVPHSILSLFVS